MRGNTKAMGFTQFGSVSGICLGFGKTLTAADSLATSRVLVLGLGGSGSGCGLPGRYLAAIGAVVVVRSRLVSTLLDTLQQARHPQRLILGRGGQQQHVTGAARIVIELTGRQRVMFVHMLLVYLVAASGITYNA